MAPSPSGVNWPAPRSIQGLSTRSVTDILGDMAVIRTVAQDLRHEIPKIRGSRFLASVLAVASQEEVKARLEDVRETFRDATHNCFAWRLGSGRDHMRYSDDGEPSGTAGRPILQEIDGRRVTDVLVVVTRYYGGTKLGTGGLVRAYGEAAAATLDLAGVVERPVVRVLHLTYGYEDTGAVKGIFNQFALEAETADYGARIGMSVAIPVEQVDDVRNALIDATQGRLAAREG